jgi:phosphate transport system permease protein
MSAAILAVARALGEAAPLLVLGGLLFGGQSPGGLPVQIFEWIGAAQPLEGEAAAAILVLLAVVLGLNGVAMIVRDRATRQIYAARGTELDQ